MGREISLRADVVVRVEQGGGVFSENAGDLAVAPQIEPAFLPVTVRIFGRIESAFGAGHIAQNVGKRFFGDAAEERVARDLVSAEIQGRKLGVVVEHLLEMRHQPGFIDRVPVKSSAHMVIDSAVCHFPKRQEGRVANGYITGRAVTPEEEFNRRVGRKLGRVAESAIMGIEGFEEFTRRGRE